MTAMSNTCELDPIMERASAALVERDYLGCEVLCEMAFGRARETADWNYLARILLPLQEARRHRRMIAAEGTIRLGTSQSAGSPGDWLTRLGPAGCIAITKPFDRSAARSLYDDARRLRRFVRVLWVNNDLADAPWEIGSATGDLKAQIAPPPVAWVDQWLGGKTQVSPAATSPSLRPSDWFLDACESLGDSAASQIRGAEGTVERFEEIHAAVSAAPDHEILHQMLARTARALAVAGNRQRTP